MGQEFHFKLDGQEYTPEQLSSAIVTLMRVEREAADGPLAFRVLGKDGSIELGGADWDETLAEYVGAQFAAANEGKNPVDDRVSYENLLLRCQDTKETLSNKKPEKSTAVNVTHEGVMHCCS